MTEKKNYISLDECEDRAIYSLFARNLSVGVFYKEKKGFIGIREKFGEEYLFIENHWDIGAPFGSAKPLEKIGMASDDVVVATSLTELKPDGSSVAVRNKALFDFLKNVNKSRD